MKNASFWHYASRMLRRRRLAAGTIVFSVISAGGLAAGLVSLGPVMRLILDDGPDASLRTVVERALPEHEWAAALVPAWIVPMLAEGRLEGVALILGCLCALTLFGAVANFLHQYCSLTLSMVTIAEIRLEAFRHALRLPLGTVLRRGPTEIVSRITRDSAELERGFSALTSKALAQLTKGIAAFAAAVWFDWRLTIAAVVVEVALAVGGGVEVDAVDDALQERVFPGDGPHVGGDAFADLVGEFADDGPDGLLGIVRPEGQVEADEFVVGLSELEGLLARADFLGDAVQFVVEDVAEALREDEREDVVLVFRRVLGPADGAGGVPDPGFEGFVFLGLEGSRFTGWHQVTGS